MTNADQPQDIAARLANIDEQLELLGDELDLIRTIQDANRREVRANSQSTARLERIACNYYRSPAIIIDRPRLLSIARNYYRSPATIIDRLQLLSIARDYYRSPATIIDRPQLLSIACNYYRSPATPKRANHLLIMIIAFGGRVHPWRTLPP